MRSFTNSPKLIKGGLVVLDAATGAVKRTQPFSLKGPVIESIKSDAEIDAIDSLEDPDQNANAVASGIVPQLAVLESLVSPSTRELLALNALSQSGTIEILPPAQRNRGQSRIL